MSQYKLKKGGFKLLNGRGLYCKAKAEVITHQEFVRQRNNLPKVRQGSEVRGDLCSF